MASRKHARRPNTKQVELEVFLGAAEHAVGKLVYVRAGQQEFSQFAYRESWLSDTRFFDVSPDLDKTLGYQVRRAATQEDSVFFFAMADTEPDSWGRRVIARAHAKGRQQNPALGPLTELDYLCAVDDHSRRMDRGVALAPQAHERHHPVSKCCAIFGLAVALPRKNPITPMQTVVAKPLGSVSRLFRDPP